LTAGLVASDGLAVTPWRPGGWRLTGWRWRLGGRAGAASGAAAARAAVCRGFDQCLPRRFDRCGFCWRAAQILRRHRLNGANSVSATIRPAGIDLRAAW